MIYPWQSPSLLFPFCSAEGDAKRSHAHPALSPGLVLVAASPDSS
jgi:hypothetical protein